MGLSIDAREAVWYGKRCRRAVDHFCGIRSRATEAGRGPRVMTMDNSVTLVAILPGALPEQFQEKWCPLFRQELRQTNV